MVQKNPPLTLQYNNVEHHNNTVNYNTVLYILVVLLFLRTWESVRLQAKVLLQEKLGEIIQGSRICNWPPSGLLGY